MNKTELIEVLKRDHLNQLPQWYCDLNCFRKPEGFPMELPEPNPDRRASHNDTELRIAFDAVSEVLGSAGTSCAWWMIELGRTREEWVAWWKERQSRIAA